MGSSNRARLLIVDDEPGIPFLMRDMLETEFYEVHIAFSGEEALQLLEKTVCDVLITDIRMDGMDGMELLKQAGQLQPDLQRMIMTGHGDIDTAVTAMKMGAVNYFLKPIDIEEILIAVSRSMEKLEMIRKIRRQRRELEQVFNVAVPICLLSKECVITRVNRAFCDCFAIREEDIRGSCGKDFLWCRTCNAEECPLAQFMKGESSHQHLWEKEINGKRVHFSVHSVPHYDESSNFIGIIITFFDMTAFQESQQQLKNTERQLLHAEKLSAVGHFSASIAHEFNNPLCGVINVLRGIRKWNSLTEGDDQLAALALKECERMSSLIRDLQQFTQPSSGIWKLVDIHQAIDEMLLFTRKEFKRRKVTVSKRYGSDIPRIWLVADQIKQVVLNVLGNAADAVTPLGQGEMIISTSHEDGLLHIHIADTGPGIQKDHLKHIFEPFFTTKTNKGAGLGLSIAYGIVRSHGGEIRVESEPNKGTVFHIDLPIQRSGQDAEKNTHS